MKNQPKVSVLLPCYNVEKYIRQCLDSVVHQTLKDIEIICINDGSKDNTLNILNEYAQKDNRIILIDKKNEGVSIARNQAIKMAKGEYLSILDSDDFFERDMLEKMYDKAILENADICVCGCSYFKNGQIQEKFYPLSDSKFKDIHTFSIQDSLFQKEMFQITAGWAWDKLYKRSFIQKKGIEFPLIHHSEDLVFVRTALVLADRITYIMDKCVYYRQYPNSLSHRQSQQPDAFYTAVMKLTNSLNKYNVFAQVRVSFLKWLVPFSLWHLSTMHNRQSKKLVIQKIKELNSFFHISDSPELFVNIPKEYKHFLCYTYPSYKRFVILSIYSGKKIMYKILYKLSIGQTRKKFKRKYKEISLK